jgi:hypothetical protein
MLPMSVDTIACAGIAFSSSRSTWRGCSQLPDSRFCSSIMSRLYASFSCVQPSSSCSHAFFSLAIFVARSALLASQASDFFSMRWKIALAAALASPAMPTVIFLTRPRLVWSASTWMIFASFGQ